jgi:hypothetical protein
MWNHLPQGLSVSIHTVDLPVEACPSCLNLMLRIPEFIHVEGIDIPLIMIKKDRPFPRIILG